MTYGHDAVLPMEIAIRSLRVAKQNELNFEEYSQSMYSELEDLDEIRFSALDHLRIQKKRAEKAYNKKVKLKTFSEEELVMKAILPIGLKDPRLGKWSPN